MTLKTKINLFFETSLNNRFSLYSSSTDRNPTPSNRASAGACLAKVAACLDKNHSSLFEQARTIETTLTPIFKEQAVFYLMELKIDGRALLAGNNQPLQIKLNERFVKTLAGGSFSPYSTVYRNPFRWL